MRLACTLVLLSSALLLLSIPPVEADCDGDSTTTALIKESTYTATNCDLDTVLLNVPESPTEPVRYRFVNSRIHTFRFQGPGLNSRRHFPLNLVFESSTITGNFGIRDVVLNASVDGGTNPMAKQVVIRFTNSRVLGIVHFLRVRWASPVVLGGRRNLFEVDGTEVRGQTGLRWETSAAGGARFVVRRSNISLLWMDNFNVDGDSDIEVSNTRLTDPTMFYYLGSTVSFVRPSVSARTLWNASFAITNSDITDSDISFDHVEVAENAAYGFYGTMQNVSWTVTGSRVARGLFFSGHNTKTIGGGSQFEVKDSAFESLTLTADDASLTVARDSLRRGSIAIDGDVLPSAHDSSRLPDSTSNSSAYDLLVDDCRVLSTMDAAPIRMVGRINRFEYLSDEEQQLCTVSVKARKYRLSVAVMQTNVSALVLHGLRNALVSNCSIDTADVLNATLHQSRLAIAHSVVAQRLTFTDVVADNRSSLVLDNVSIAEGGSVEFAQLSAINDSSVRFRSLWMGSSASGNTSGSLTSSYWAALSFQQGNFTGGSVFSIEQSFLPSLLLYRVDFDGGSTFALAHVAIAGSHEVHFDERHPMAIMRGPTNSRYSAILFSDSALGVIVSQIRNATVCLVNVSVTVGQVTIGHYSDINQVTFTIVDSVFGVGLSLSNTATAATTVGNRTRILWSGSTLMPGGQLALAGTNSTLRMTSLGSLGRTSVHVEGHVIEHPDVFDCRWQHPVISANGTFEVKLTKVAENAGTNPSGQQLQDVCNVTVIDQRPPQPVVIRQSRLGHVRTHGATSVTVVDIPGVTTVNIADCALLSGMDVRLQNISFVQHGDIGAASSSSLLRVSRVNLSLGSRVVVSHVRGALQEPALLESIEVVGPASPDDVAAPVTGISLLNSSFAAGLTLQHLKFVSSSYLAANDDESSSQGDLVVLVHHVTVGSGHVRVEDSQFIAATVVFKHVRIQSGIVYWADARLVDFSRLVFQNVTIPSTSTIQRTTSRHGYWTSIDQTGLGWGNLFEDVSIGIVQSATANASICFAGVEAGGGIAYGYHTHSKDSVWALRDSTIGPTSIVASGYFTTFDNFTTAIGMGVTFDRLKFSFGTYTNTLATRRLCPTRTLSGISCGLDIDGMTDAPALGWASQNSALGCGCGRMTPTAMATIDAGLSRSCDSVHALVDNAATLRAVASTADDSHRPPSEAVADAEGDASSLTLRSSCAVGWLDEDSARAVARLRTATPSRSTSRSPVMVVTSPTVTIDRKEGETHHPVSSTVTAVAAPGDDHDPPGPPQSATVSPNGAGTVTAELTRTPWLLPVVRNSVSRSGHGDTLVADDVQQQERESLPVPGAVVSASATVAVVGSVVSPVAASRIPAFAGARRVTECRLDDGLDDHELVFEFPIAPTSGPMRSFVAGALINAGLMFVTGVCQTVAASQCGRWQTVASTRTVSGVVLAAVPSLLAAYFVPTVGTASALVLVGSGRDDGDAGVEVPIVLAAAALTICTLVLAARGARWFMTGRPRGALFHLVVGEGYRDHQHEGGDDLAATGKATTDDDGKHAAPLLDNARAVVAASPSDSTTAGWLPRLKRSAAAWVFFAEVLFGAGAAALGGAASAAETQCALFGWLLVLLAVAQTLFHIVLHPFPTTLETAFAIASAGLVAAEGVAAIVPLSPETEGFIVVAATACFFAQPIALAGHWWVVKRHRRAGEADTIERGDAAGGSDDTAAAVVAMTAEGSTSRQLLTLPSLQNDDNNSGRRRSVGGGHNAGVAIPDRRARGDRDELPMQQREANPLAERGRL